MTASRLLVACITATAVMATVIRRTATEVYTSQFNIRRMLAEEELLLEEFKSFVDLQYKKLQSLFRFYSDRLQYSRFREHGNVNLDHPNSVYNVIKNYTQTYFNALGEYFHGFYTTVEIMNSGFLAGQQDIEGGLSTLLRLQKVYGLRASDMVRGDYLGYQGPQLDVQDAILIGRKAIAEYLVNQSLDWLNVSLTLLSADNTSSYDQARIGLIKAVMGRAHLYNQNERVARELFSEAQQLDPQSEEVRSLEDELRNVPDRTPEDEDWVQNFTRLCCLEKGIYPAERNNQTRPLFCRYREAVFPYYKFKEEILSFSPFVSVIYDVITDNEGDHMRDYVKDRIYTAEIETQTRTDLQVRTSGVAWISDQESAIAGTVSKRISAITGLETSHSESFQVVNYGVGGHYNAHTDPLSKRSLEIRGLDSSSDRLATFLIYLNDVEKGGATVFTLTGAAVTPVKNMALFWYNFNPAHKQDELTLHGGCPVLIGQKWIVNKWIWNRGNLFRRRCGLRENDTQMDIEPDMKRGYR